MRQNLTYDSNGFKYFVITPLALQEYFGTRDVIEKRLTNYCKKVVTLRTDLRTFGLMYGVYLLTP